MSIDPQRVTLLALLALGPVGWFVIQREPLVGLSAGCVIVIAWSLHRMFGPINGQTSA